MNLKIAVVTLLALAVALFLITILFRTPTTKKQSHNKSKTPEGKPPKRVSDGYIIAPANLDDADKDNEPPAQDQNPIALRLAQLNLLRIEDLGKILSAKVAGMTTTIVKPNPMLHNLVSGVTEPDELIRIIKTDPEITAKVLGTVNSAAFGLAQPITSINHAIIYLGLNLVKDIATKSVLEETIKFSTAEQRVVAARLWSASYIASSLGLQLALELGDEHPTDTSTQALLSYLGDLALLSRFPEIASNYLQEPSSFERIAYQQKNYQLNAMIISSSLAESWKLPSQLFERLNAGLLPMVAGPEIYPYDDPSMGSVLISYIACRLGDQIAWNGITDIANVTLSDPADPTLYYLPTHIEKAGFGKIYTALSNASFRKKANQIINRLNTPQPK